MLTSRTTAAVAVAGLVASSALLTAAPSQADVAPQEKDVVATGSDILQSAYNFLADGYGALPGYNSAGNRWRFINLDSTGDAQGRTAYTDPRLLATITGNGTVGASGVKYVRQDEVKQLNPAVALRAGQPLVVRPSGGSGGGLGAIINDYVDGNNIGNWIDVGRSPDPVGAVGDNANQNLALNQLGSKLYSVVFGTDRQVIATAAESNAPASLSAAAIKKIYTSSSSLTWGQIDGYQGPGAELNTSAPAYTGPGANETIIPLQLPDDAGMWSTFRNGVRAANGGLTTGQLPNADFRLNPSGFIVQQNDPTAITGLTDAVQRRNAIVPFPRSRETVVNDGYYTRADDGATLTNPYNGLQTYTGKSISKSGTKAELGNHRLAASASGIKLLAKTSTASGSTSPYGTNFALRAIFRESDLNSDVPWQPGSTLNWVRTLFYNPPTDDEPDPALPFVRTPAGKALIESAGQTPSYQVFGTNNAEIPE